MTYESGACSLGFVVFSVWTAHLEISFAYSIHYHCNIQLAKLFGRLPFVEDRAEPIICKNIHRDFLENPTSGEASHDGPCKQSILGIGR